MKKDFSILIVLLLALFTINTNSIFARETPDKMDPEIAFDKESLEYTIGQDEPFVEPKLINPHNVPVYFVSDNNSAATVDTSTGKVTFITQGVVKISAISNETDLYNPAQVSYTINVSDNSIIFEASFLKDDCGFTQEGGVKDAEVWTHETDGYMKADAYGVVDKMTSFYLVSPEFTLNKTGNTVSFGECGSYFGNRWNQEAQLVIRTQGGEWTVIDRNYFVGDQNQVQSTGDIIIPSEFNGKKVQMAFRYSSDGHKNSGVWHVRNLHVKASQRIKSDAGLSFDVEKMEYIIDSGDSFEAPVLHNPNNLEVRYSSSSGSVAAVDAVSGEVSVLSEGTTTISAESAETEEFSAGKASYILKVTNASDAQYADPAQCSPIVAVEFTGQRCRYCPNMSRGLQEYQNKYGKDNFIITALHHLKDFSLLPESQVSLYNEEAMEYAVSLEIHEGLPQLAYNTLGPERSDLTVEEKFKEDDFLECTGSVKFNNDNEYEINIKTRLRSNQKEIAKNKHTDLILWTLENGIVAFQDDNGTYSYPEHNHIFRGSINTTWGEPYEVGTEYSSTLKAPASVSDIKNTEVIALFIDHDSRMILDACAFTATDIDNTGIENINAEQADPAVYNLMGMKVNDTVRGGIYIKNGKKFVAR